MGTVLGTIVSLNGLFNLIKDIDPMIGWGIMGGLSIIFALILFTMIREPVDIEKKADGVCVQIKDLSVNICKAIKKNPNLLAGWVFYALTDIPGIILEVYLMSWLNSLNAKGLFPTTDDKDDMYSRQGTIGCLLAFFFLAAYG